MSSIQHAVSAKQLAANQANAQKSTGPKTPAGKARASLNSFKHGAYAKIESRRREVMLKRGQDPGEYEELHQELVDSWQPEDAMQAMVVKTIADRTWDKLQLRRAWLDGQLGTLESAQIQAQRRQLAARRWLASPPFPGSGGLCALGDSAGKFQQIFSCLNRLQKWLEDDVCPDEYPKLMEILYDRRPTVAGQRIGELFVQLFDDDQAVCEKARQELPKWIGQEKADVEQDLELCRRELTFRAASKAALPEEQVASKEATLDRQIAEQTRLLLQLKSKRSLWGSESQTSQGSIPADQTVEDSRQSTVQGEGSSLGEGASAGENGQNGQTKPLEGVESMT